MNSKKANLDPCRHFFRPEADEKTAGTGRRAHEKKTMKHKLHRGILLQHPSRAAAMILEWAWLKDYRPVSSATPVSGAFPTRGRQPVFHPLPRSVRIKKT